MYREEILNDQLGVFDVDRWDIMPASALMKGPPMIMFRYVVTANKTDTPRRNVMHPLTLIIRTNICNQRILQMHLKAQMKDYP
jgi:hypothetical protein